MSPDDGVDRKRPITPPALPTGPLKDFKDALFGLYLSADTPSMEQIRARILQLAEGDEASEPTATPSVDTVHKVLTAKVLPPNIKHVVAVTAALLYPHNVPGVVPVVRGNPRVEEIRRLWERARLHVPPGRPITDTLPADLEVRGTMPPTQDDASPLPDYIAREHDHYLRELAAAALSPTDPRSGVAVLISDSTSGKTRALFEVLRHPVLPESGPRGRERPRSLADAGWRVWPTLSAYPADRFLAELPHVQARTVVWLNEAQRYLIDPDERTARDIAAGLRALLADPARTPVLVLGTLWPPYRDRITRAAGDGRDRYADARALLTGHTVQVPDVFTGIDLDAARASTDTRVRDAVAAADAATLDSELATRVHLTQYMAGVPALRDLYHHASTTEAAVLHAAVDARRSGHGEWVPVTLLHHAAPAYLDEHQQRQHLCDPDWFTRALDALTASRDAAAARALHYPPFLPGELIRDVVRLEDYLDQHGRADRAEQVPPTGFWTAAAVQAQPDDLTALGESAKSYGLYGHAAQLYKNAAAQGNARAAIELLRLLHKVHPTDHRPQQWVVDHIDFRNPWAGVGLLKALSKVGASKQVTEVAAESAAQHAALDNAQSVARLLEALREVCASKQTTELMAARAAQHAALDDPDAVAELLGALRRVSTGEHASAFADRAAQHTPLDKPAAVAELLEAMHTADARSQASVLADRAAQHTTLDDVLGVACLLGVLHRVDAGSQASVLADRAAEHATLDDPDGVAGLLDELHTMDAGKQTTNVLARLPVDQIALDNLTTVARLLEVLHTMNASKQAADVLARLPVDQIALDNLTTVAGLLNVLHTVGAGSQASALADRAARRTTLNNSSGVADLLRALRQVDANKQASALIKRFPAAGLFDMFVENDDNNARFRFGQESGSVGTPAAPWTWHDLA